MAKQSVMRVATIAQQTPLITASTSDPVCSQAAEPAIPNNASVSNTGLIMRTNGLVGTNVSAGLKRSHSRRSLVSHLAPELTSVHTSTRER